MRIRVSLQGQANAQALFDVMHGRAVSWHDKENGWHVLTFDHDSVEAAREHITTLFPKLRRFAIRQASARELW